MLFLNLSSHFSTTAHNDLLLYVKPIEFASVVLVARLNCFILERGFYTECINTFPENTSTLSLRSFLCTSEGES